MKPHQNIFFYYRGPSSRDEQVYDRQLENNTTKALVNVLEHGGADIVSAFLRLGGAPATDGAPSVVRFKLQAEPSILRNVLHRSLVSLTPGTELPIDELDYSHDDRRRLPDAIIYCLPSFGVIIESKVGAPLSLEQLRGHARTAGWRQFTHKALTWVHVYDQMRSLTTSESRAKFLRQQFCEYLELVGLAPFPGFRPIDFDFFVTREDEYAPLLRAKFGQFGHEVFRRLPRSIRDCYPVGVYVGKTSGRGGLWLGFRRVRNGRDPFVNCNLTAELDESTLSFNAVIRDGRASDRAKPIGILSQRMSRDADRLLGYLRKLGPDFSLLIYRRDPRRGNRIMPGNEKWTLEYMQRLDSLVPETGTMISGLLRDIEFPGIHFRRELLRGPALEMSPLSLIELGATSARMLHPILRFVETGRFRLATRSAR